MKPWVLLLLLILTTLSGPGRATALADRSKSVAVLVLAGHQVELARVGAMVFANKRANLQAPDDTLTEGIYLAVKEELEKEGRARVSRLVVPRENMAQLATSVESATSILLGPDEAKLAPVVAPFRSSCSCDAILLVAPLRRQVHPNSNQFVTGMVWLGRGGITGEAVSRTAVIANLMFYLFDAQSGGLASTSLSAHDRFPERDHTPLPVGSWPVAMTELSAEQWSAFVEAQGKELRLSLRWPLYRLGFRPSCLHHYHRIANPGPGRDANQDPFAQSGPPPMPEGADPARCM